METLLLVAVWQTVSAPPGRKDKPGVTVSPKGSPNGAAKTDATQGRAIECGMNDTSPPPRSG